MSFKRFAVAGLKLSPGQHCETKQRESFLDVKVGSTGVSLQSTGKSSKGVNGNMILISSKSGLTVGCLVHVEFGGLRSIPALLILLVNY